MKPLEAFQRVTDYTGAAAQLLFYAHQVQMIAMNAQKAGREEFSEEDLAEMRGLDDQARPVLQAVIDRKENELANQQAS